MNLGSIMHIAAKHKRYGWTGYVMCTDDVIALCEEIGRAREAATKARLALLDHDLETVRRHLNEIARK
jgi:hypothetical protein